jgi:hypothetical protein
MAASLYRNSDLQNATYGTPPISGMIVTAFSINETAAITETKDDQGAVVAVAVAEPISEISFEGMRTGEFALTVGGLLSVTLPGVTGGTTIVTGFTTNYAAEAFETLSGTARRYEASLS